MTAGPHRSVYWDDPTMAALLQEYVQRMPEHVQQIQLFLRANKADELRRELHQLRGSGRSFGFQEISTLAGVAEELLLMGEPLATAKETIEALVEYLEQVEGYGAS
jgi:HPt (histidine-containing phosphotransfer) domain-containing protein